MIQDTSSKIRNVSSLVEHYSELRVQRCGVDGILPAEFFPTYQWLRPNDWTRCYQVIDDVAFVFKKVRIYSAQFNRLEGLPISLTGDRTTELRVTQDLFSSGWIHKVRCCQLESDALECMGFSKLQKEAAVANFWYDTAKKARRTQMSSWRPRSVLNWALKNGTLTWGPASASDFPGVSDLFQSWIRKKEIEKQAVMYKELYQSILDKLSRHSDKLNISVLSWNSKPIALVVHLISGGCAHLLANVNVSNTAEDFGVPEKLRPYVGSIIPFFSSKSFVEQGVRTAFLGYCEENDPLIKYKRSLADGETKLSVVEISDKPLEKKNEAPRGFI